jgi:ribonuclease P protein component
VSRARFPQRVRLLTPAQFDRAFKQGRRLHQGPLSAVLAPNALEHPRIGFALGKKFAKRAVQRNRLKRLLRERFRHRQGGLQAVDMVVFLRSRLTDSANAEVEAVERLWAKLDSTCAKP